MSRLPTFFAGAALAAATILPFASLAGPQDPGMPSGEDMMEMMKRAEKFITPGEHHKTLERFIGKWNITTHLFHGEMELPGEPGTAEFSWLYPGRWMQQKSTGSMMGRPLEGFHLMGYDNFKQSFVSTSVSTMDTAMNTSEGDMDPGGKLLISYGTIDEYLSGEHDKMVKTVWKFISDDEMVFEIHDLPIGEEHTKVVEIRYSRAK